MIRFLTAILFLIGSASVSMAQDFYRIKPGDTLQVEVLEDPGLNRSVLVLPDGSISFPLAGTVKVGGRSVDTVASTLSKEMASNFAVSPTVLVSVAALAPKSSSRAAAQPNLMNVYILGEVNNPGRKEILPDTTLIQFLAEAGGLSRFAAEKRIQLRRVDPAGGDETVYRFNYRTMGGSDSISGTTVLAPGDVIVVPERRLFE
ncbi:polysaccharide export outer membrane protein [Roseovarius marisflavi]|uniref:Polysaccharide export outer membrane protein n=1 Tax=Roseovarius marisflavi TaxID=1054996 RepID=A0A1M7CGB3_9RHOB|nr:polysaccharide biosynthesis/export family protein [Roseovarius marisflavi]SHL66217.1 polysaccharide export outer membrane protein [Roseovarius marisflavi]